MVIYLTDKLIEFYGLFKKRSIIIEYIHYQFFHKM